MSTHAKICHFGPVIAAMLLVAAAAMAGVPVDSTETWDAGTTAGWTSSAERAAVSNPGDALLIAHPRQSMPIYAEDTVQGPVPVGLRLTNVTFRFRSAHVAPSALRLVLHSWRGEREWYSPLVPPAAETETEYSVPVDFETAKWTHGPGSGAAEFEQDLQLVDRVGVYVRRHADTAEQDYRLDDFSVKGLYTEDVDGDGIPNRWEIDYGFDPDALSDGAGNADGDRMSNYAEYRAGTDPRDASSFLRLFIDATNTGAGVVLRWASISNRTYRIWSGDGSVTGLTPVAGGIPSTDEVTTFTPPAGEGRVRFYRLEVE